FLKDKGDISQIKEVNVFDTGANEWRDVPNWSPTVSTDTALYLMDNGQLRFGDGVTGKRPPGGTKLFDEYTSDPMNPVPYTEKRNGDTIRYPRDFMTEDQRFAATRPAVLVYQTDPLTADITVAGSIKPELFISSSGTDSDFVVKLIDVFPDDFKLLYSLKPPASSAGCVSTPGGYEMLLRGEPFPARFRDSFEKQLPL